MIKMQSALIRLRVTNVVVKLVTTKALKRNALKVYFFFFAISFDRIDLKVCMRQHVS